MRDDAFKHQIIFDADGWQRLSLEFHKFADSVFVLDGPLFIFDHFLHVARGAAMDSIIYPQAAH
jgi:hypothetical protein